MILRKNNKIAKVNRTQTSDSGKVREYGSLGCYMDMSIINTLTTKQSIHSTISNDDS